MLQQLLLCNWHRITGEPLHVLQEHWSSMKSPICEFGQVLSCLGSDKGWLSLSLGAVRQGRVELHKQDSSQVTIFLSCLSGRLLEEE